MIDIAQIRLECVKLAHRHDKTPEDVVAVAKVYEQYVVNESQAKPKRSWGPENHKPSGLVTAKKE
jgi:hypothetical protein